MIGTSVSAFHPFTRSDHIAGAETRAVVERPLYGLAVEPLNYYAVLDEIHKTLYPRTYLEIGVFQGYGLNTALPGTRVVGVDPDPRIVAPLPADAVIENVTSDAFFESQRITTHLAGVPVDLAFIDGMHLWEYSLRDFLNVERSSHPGSIILIHDCLPHSAQMAAREQCPGWWTGDVWKLLYFIREECPDLDVTVVDAPATGLGIVQGLNPTREAIDIEAVVARYMNLDFSAFEADLLPSLRVVRSEPGELRRNLPETPWQSIDNLETLITERSRRQPSPRARVRRLALQARSSAPVRLALRTRRRLFGYPP